MKTVVILTALVVLASAKTMKSSGPNVQIRSLGASRVDGVEIIDIIVEDIVSTFVFDNLDIPKDIFENSITTVYKVRQASLNHNPFTVIIDVRSEVATNVMIKVFLGPENDNNGFPLSIEDNWDWETFVELDSFVYALSPGQNTIVRTNQIDSSLFLSLTGILQNAGLNFVVSATKLI